MMLPTGPQVTPFARANGGSGGAGSVVTPPQPVATGDLSGQWVSTSDGVQTQATLQQSGATLSGTFSESGMTLPFQATLAGTIWNGTLTFQGQQIAVTLTPTATGFDVSMMLPTGPQVTPFARAGGAAVWPGG